MQHFHLTVFWYTTLQKDVKVNGSVSKCKATELKRIRGLSHFYGIYIGGRDSIGSFVTALMQLDLHYIWLPV